MCCPQGWWARQRGWREAAEATAGRQNPKRNPSPTALHPARAPHSGLLRVPPPSAQPDLTEHFRGEDSRGSPRAGPTGPNESPPPCRAHAAPPLLPSARGRGTCPLQSVSGLSTLEGGAVLGTVFKNRRREGLWLARGHTASVGEELGFEPGSLQEQGPRRLLESVLGSGQAARIRFQSI